MLEVVIKDDANLSEVNFMYDQLCQLDGVVCDEVEGDEFVEEIQDVIESNEWEAVETTDSEGNKHKIEETVNEETGEMEMVVS